MIVCLTCGEENPEHARFCLACGAMLEAAAPAGEERKVVSVLFVDLVGFTHRSDRADPEDVRATLRPYHERVKADIERFGGTVEKFIGDAVMAVFGAPVSHEDDAERAVRSGLRVLETIEELRAEGLGVAVRAAVTTGEAVVALGARPERGEGIVTGDVVNTAARLQAAAPEGSVLVDETTVRSSDRAIAFEQLEAVEAKGKAEAIPVWRALHAKSRVGEAEAAVHTPFVGREHERALLLETFLRAERESSVQLVTVVGEPGIGKSRLVTELRAALDDRPELITWRHGRCLPYGEGITFWALGEIVKAEAGILESDDREVAANKLHETVAALVANDSERPWFFSRLAPLVGVGGDGASVDREETFTAWRRFLEALAERRSLVLVVEDLHWADDALFEFVEHLLDWSAPVPILFLCTARPELLVKQPSWGGGKRNATTISLSPLSGEEAGRLLQLLLDRTLLPAETQSLLLERAGGNPLYAEQFARMLEERGEGAELVVPATVQALVAARLDTLRPELKALLQDAAVVGRIFWSGAVAEVGGRSHDDVRRGLNELVRREFLRPLRVSSVEGEDEFSFWHALVRDVAYQQIPRAPRADKHLAAAAWVEALGAERLEDHAEILVHHYGEARDLLGAAGRESSEAEAGLAHFLVLAADRATQLDAAAAEAYLRRALALTDSDDLARGRALAKLAFVLEVRGEVEESIAADEAAIDLLRELDPRVAATSLYHVSLALWGRGEMERASACDEEAIAILERDPVPELVAAYGEAAIRTALGGQLDDSERLIEKGVGVARNLGVEDVTALLLARAAARGYRGDPGGVDDARDARDLGLRLGLGRTTAVAINNLADITSSFVGMREARALWDEAIEFGHDRGLTYTEQWARGERLRALYHLGEWEALRRDAREVIGWAEHGHEQLEVVARINLTALLAHTGEAEEAGANVAALVPKARASGDPQVVVPGLAIAALVAATRGDDAEALAYVCELEELTRGDVIWRAYCLLWPVRVALARGELELAESFLDGPETDAAWNACARLGATAALAEARGSSEAAALYRDGAGRWAEYGSVVEQAYALIGAGRRGDTDALREGEAVFERLGASPVLARAA